MKLKAIKNKEKEEPKEEQNNYSIKNLLNKKDDKHEEIMDELLNIKKEVKKIRKIMFFNKVIIFIIVILVALGVQIGIKFLQPVFEDYTNVFNSTLEVINNIPNN
jgi:pheromone shutdown protein TraB